MGLVHADLVLRNPKDVSLASLQVRALVHTGASDRKAIETRRHAHMDDHGLCQDDWPRPCGATA